jgi:hypothetical protein
MKSNLGATLLCLAVLICACSSAMAQSAKLSSNPLAQKVYDNYMHVVLGDVVCKFIFPNEFPGQAQQQVLAYYDGTAEELYQEVYNDVTNIYMLVRSNKIPLDYFCLDVRQQLHKRYGSQ